MSIAKRIDTYSFVCNLHAMGTLLSKNIIMGSQLPKLKNNEKQNEKMKKQNKTKQKTKKRDSLQTCPSHKSYEVKAVGLSLFNYSTFKIKIL